VNLERSVVYAMHLGFKGLGSDDHRGDGRLARITFNISLQNKLISFGSLISKTEADKYSLRLYLPNVLALVKIEISNV
jgi:hypothetical protein